MCTTSIMETYGIQKTCLFENFLRGTLARSTDQMTEKHVVSAVVELLWKELHDKGVKIQREFPAPKKMQQRKNA